MSNAHRHIHDSQDPFHYIDVADLSFSSFDQLWIAHDRPILKKPSWYKNTSIVQYMNYRRDEDAQRTRMQDQYDRGDEPLVPVHGRK